MSVFKGKVLISIIFVFSGFVSVRHDDDSVCRRISVEVCGHTKDCILLVCVWCV